MASLAYVGGIQNKTIYEESTVTETISYTNYEEFFDVALSASSTSAAFISAGDNNEFIITVKPRNSSSTYNTCVLTAVDDITVPFNLYCTAVCRSNYTRYYIVKPDGTQSTITSSGDTTIAINGMANGEQITIKAITSTSDTSTIIQSIQVQMDAQKTFTIKTPIGTQSVSVDKPVSSIYAGVTATVPVYTETTTTEDITLSADTLTDFFSADSTGTTGTNAKGITWANNSDGGLKLTFGNYGIDSSTSMTTFTAQRNLTNVVISGLYYTEANYDKITLIVAGTTILNAVSGTSYTLTQRWAGSLSEGQTIVLKFVKDGSASASNESSTYFTLSCDPYQKTTTTQIQTGTETKLVDKKIIKGYIGGPDGKARLFFGDVVAVAYTGEYTTSDVTVDDVACTLYTLTGSGTLTVNVNGARYWMCGGGAGGGAYATDKRCGGGGGYVSSGDIVAGTYVITIGAGGAAEANGNATTATGDNTYTANGASGANGGSGGGGGGIAGHGAGVTTYPFGLTDLLAHCAGGGGGAAYSSGYMTGSKGGTNGGNGSANGSSGTSAGFYNKGGAGGEYGGGDGAKTNGSDSTDASFYGGGGGGHGRQGSAVYSGATAGYQGVAYVLVPA